MRHVETTVPCHRADTGTKPVENKVSGLEIQIIQHVLSAKLLLAPSLQKNVGLCTKKFTGGFPHPHILGAQNTCMDCHMQRALIALQHMAVQLEDMKEKWPSSFWFAMSNIFPLDTEEML